MKKILIVTMLALTLNGCGKKGGGGAASDNPNLQNSCVFSNLSDFQIQSIRNELSNAVQTKIDKNRCDLEKIYQTLSAELVFEILAYNKDADILGAIENNDLTGFLSHAFDEESCEVLPIEQQTIDLTKKCDWEK